MHHSIAGMFTLPLEPEWMRTFSTPRDIMTTQYRIVISAHWRWPSSRRDSDQEPEGVNGLCGIDHHRATSS